jgi:hypothetical protein
MASEKWVDDLDSIVALAVIHVLGIDDATGGFVSGGDDEGIPVGELVAGVDGKCSEECFCVEGGDGKQKQSI